MEKRRHAFFFHNQASQWTQLGDRVIGEFFEIIGPKHRRVGVKHLKKPDGTMAIKLEEIQEVATDFSRDLLTTDPLLEAQDICRQQV